MSFPAGHFYSPVCDPVDLSNRVAELWPAQPEVLGIDMNDAYHLKVLTEWFPKYIPEFDYPESGDEQHATGYFTGNSQFSWLDARALFVLLREWRPKRLVEVGSGFSTLLSLDVKRRFINHLELTCVEPYPRPFLSTIPDINLIQQRVEKIDIDVFRQLEAGDVLFIDSSHVAKTGSDVNFLIFEVLPRLNAGVRIHIHDIFLPSDYPQEWAISENRSWNEQYVVRALLMYSTAFRVLFGCAYAKFAFPTAVPFGGGSLWIERCAA
jgi:hypothetical protein